MTDRPCLHALSDRLGILSSYVDVTGTTQVTSDESRETLLAAMGVAAPTERAAQEHLEALAREDAKRVIEPVRVVREDWGDVGVVRFRLPADRAHERAWRLGVHLEDGTAYHVEGRGPSDGHQTDVAAHVPGQIPLGYHEVELVYDGADAPGRHMLIVTPTTCLPLSDRIGDGRAGGIWCNLYTLRSQDDWGVGDLGDLKSLVRTCGGHGVQFVGINPLHATYNRQQWIAPYCPVSRLYRNIVYIDVEAVPEFADCEPAQRLYGTDAFSSALGACRAAHDINYEVVASLKVQVLRLLHHAFVDRHHQGRTTRGRAYQAYLEREGDALTRFATFCALSEQPEVQQATPAGWHHWPESYRMPDSPAVGRFRERKALDVDFHRFCQFELDRQLQQAAEEAKTQGMSIGLYQDLAIGSAGDGSDAWSDPGLLVPGMKVGAPPDPYCAVGQTWGFPPADPRAMRAGGYRYWSRLLRANMAHAGMLRIDHVVGLFRQFWVPSGADARTGAYVRYPADDLLGVLALESRRNETVVVGEDLGTVPPEVPPKLWSWGMLSSRVFYFEREYDGSFRSAEHYIPQALVTATTHDHVPLAGFWARKDLEIHRDIGTLDSHAAFTEAQAERDQVCSVLVRRLVDDGLLSADGPESYGQLCEAVYAFLARTPCLLVGISLDDLSGEEEPVNLPGVSYEVHASWTRRMTCAIEALQATPRFMRIVEHVIEQLGCKV